MGTATRPNTPRGNPSLTVIEIRAPGEKLTAQLVRTPAMEVMALNQQVAELDKVIEARFRDHQDFDVITSLCRSK
ncbi:hypothetical protein [Streptomyces torulosus]|uniref:hypothetical protein n=1 Tax=Streptomyces torulosus TaxID=68276 RepID=UPI00099F0532|nr:hypothetical protein [Streptomyces torulosus]